MFRRYLARRDREKFYGRDLGVPTPEQQALIEELRLTIRGLPALQTDGTTHSETWTRFRNQVRAEILAKDPRKFTCWPTIMASMYCIPKAVEFHAVTARSALTSLQPKFWGMPKPYPGLAVDENTVHHCYVLQRLLELNPDLNEFDLVVEFGGGYGNLNTILRDLGFAGCHVIFDFPEFSALQRFYLAGNGYLQKYSNTHFVSELPQLGNVARSFQSTRTIFVGHWSVSESPIHVREAVLSAAPASNFFFCFQDQFDGIDNVGYFKTFAEKRPDLKWSLRTFEHIRNNFSLVGLCGK